MANNKSKVKTVKEKGPPGIGELRKLDELRMEGVPEYPHLYEQAMALELPRGNKPVYQEDDIYNSIYVEGEPQEDDYYASGGGARARQTMRDIKAGIGKADWKELQRKKAEVNIKEGKIPDRSYYVKNDERISGTRPEMVLNPSTLGGRAGMISAHEMGHAWDKKDLYEENPTASPRLHKPNLMDVDVYGIPMIQRLIDKGYPRNEAIRAVRNELTYPEEDYGTLPPEGEKGAEVDWRVRQEPTEENPEGKVTRPWAKKQQPYKDWDDFNARGQEFVEKRISKKQARDK